MMQIKVNKTETSEASNFLWQLSWFVGNKIKQFFAEEKEIKQMKIAMPINL